MIAVEKLAEKVFGVLKGFGHQVKLFTDEGAETVDPKEARRFFCDSGLMVTVNEDENELVLSKSASEPLEETRQLQRNLKTLANKFLMNYTVRSYGKSIQPRDFSYEAKIKRKNNNMAENKVNEGLSKLSGSKKTSHQTLENVKILVKHRTEVDEERRGSRSRNIQAIFLERAGERFRFPTNHLGGARAMARHMQEGGEMSDRVGSYIIESVNNLLQLNEFYRYAKSNKLVNEDTSDIVDTIKENIDSVKTELKRLTGVKTYESIKARIEESEEQELHEEDISSLRDMFTVRKFDEKFDAVLPVVNRMVQEKNNYLRRIEEASGNAIHIGPQSFSIDAILEFANESARVGHKLSEISGRIIENAELATFVSKVGQKLCKEGTINAFEQDVMNNVLSNLQIQQVQESNETISESKVFESYFDKYSYMFV